MQHAVKAGIVHADLLRQLLARLGRTGEQVEGKPARGNATLTLNLLGDGAQFVVVATQQDNAGAIARVGQGRFTTNPVAGPGDQDDAIFQQVTLWLIMHGNSLGDRFPIALHLWYLTFALLCLKAPAIAIGEAESIHKINILQRFQPREKKRNPLRREHKAQRLLASG